MWLVQFCSPSWSIQYTALLIAGSIPLADRAEQNHKCLWAVASIDRHAMTLLLPACLLLFLGVYVRTSHGTALPPTYDVSMCSESFRCGGVEIGYPFYLANATQVTANNTSYACGYTDLAISCGQGEGGSWAPAIHLDGDSYAVQNIFYNTSTIILVDSAVVAGGSCPAVWRNVTFDQEWLNTTRSYANLTFFLGCQPTQRDPVPSELARYQINCTGFNNPPGGGVSFLFTSEQLGRSQRGAELPFLCTELVAAPVRKQILMTSNQSTFTTGGYGEVLKQGFELSWSRIKTDPCYLCEKSGGRCSYSDQKAFLGCLCSDGKVGVEDCKISGSNNTVSPSSSHDGNKRTKMYIIVSTSCFLFLCLLTLALLWTWKYGLLPFKPKDEPWIVSFLQKNGNLHPKRYTYAEVKRMTKSFSTKLGQGGFGTVYRGNLSDGCQVAVKMLKDSKGDGEQFMNEVASISRTSHVNVVTLLGFCLQGSKRALIYEYMANGSLERYAFGSNANRENTLSWNELFDIAIGIARGLEYLHRGCNTRIVHFDIKPHNILLDQDFCPKISDFGLAKLCLNKESAISIGGARGTIGYIAPEVYSKQFGTISSKSDVYSYGMMVLEMVGARDKNINANTESSSQYFPQWIYEHLDDYCISASEINGETTEIVRKMIVVGLWCIQMNPTDRPIMTRVVEMLEGSTSNLELPPKALLSL